MPLSASSGISLITCFIISARETTTLVSKWDIKQTILKHKDNISLVLHPVLSGKSKYDTSTC